MKKLLFSLFLLLSALSLKAQQPDQHFSAALTATCANANTACTTAGSQVLVTTSLYGVMTVTTSGTYSGSTINFEFSDDGGVTWFQNTCSRSDSPVAEGSEALPTNQVRSWDCGIAGVTNARVRQSALSTGSPNIGVTLTAAQIDPVPTFQQSQTPGLTDPCALPGVLKSHVFKNITTATTTALVAPSGTTNILVCGVDIQLISTVTPDTVLLESGTGAACAVVTGCSAAGVCTGTYSNGNGTSLNFSEPIHLGFGGATYFATGTSNGLCAVTTVGTTPAITIDVTFIQQ